MKETFLPNIILIGSTGRNAGKTELAAALIKFFAAKGMRTAAAKIVTAESIGARCPRGGEGCGACRLDTDFVLTVEKEYGGEKNAVYLKDTAYPKDTARLLKAGADCAFLLRSVKYALKPAFDALLEKTRLALGGEPPAFPFIIESNSLCEVIKPALFIMLCGEEPPKPSAAAVISKANLIIKMPFTDKDFQTIIENIKSKFAIK